MNTKDKITQIISKKGFASAKDLYSTLGLSERIIFRHLRDLVDNGTLIKKGQPPKVYYFLNPTNQEPKEFTNLDRKIYTFINQNFLAIKPNGTVEEGISAFLQWCHDRSLSTQEYARKYYKQHSDTKALREYGLINAAFKLQETFKEYYLEKLFYSDFYAIEIFGKTKLGQLLLYAKQSQDKTLIKQIVSEINNDIHSLIKREKVDAVGFIPPTISRNIQFMKELEKHLQINLPKINIVKLRTPVVVPQKSLNKLKDRVENIQSSVVVDDPRKFKKVLLIDDAVGSGASMNEIARMIKNFGSKKVIGYAIVGSKKGFDVISEV